MDFMKKERGEIEGVEGARDRTKVQQLLYLKKSAANFSPPPSAPRKALLVSVEQQTPIFTLENDVRVLNEESVTDNGNNQDGEADGYSVYIKGLPMNATEASLEEIFKKFGTIKIDVIQVRSNKCSDVPVFSYYGRMTGSMITKSYFNILPHQEGFFFGFVGYEEASSVQKALKSTQGIQLLIVNLIRILNKEVDPVNPFVGIYKKCYYSLKIRIVRVII